MSPSVNESRVEGGERCKTIAERMKERERNVDVVVTVSQCS